MPRTEGMPMRMEVVSARKSLVASAANLTNTTIASSPSKPPKPEAWQTQAWQWYDLTPEYRYCAQWVGNILSKAKLFITKDGVKTDEQPVLDLLASLYGGVLGQAQMFRQLGIHMTVAGEGYIVGIDNGPGKDDDWFVVAATEIKKVNDTTWKINKQEIEDPLVIRIWRPHPRLFNTSDSATRPLLNILSELDGLTKRVAAEIDSRLTSAGILLMPTEMSFSGGSGQNPEDGASMSGDANELLKELVKVATIAVQDRASAAALVPIIVQAPGEVLDKIQHLTFWSELDNHSVELRKEAIGRLALGMDMPPEVLLGTADMNHWSAWQMEEAGIKAHTDPLLQILVDGLTEKYLRVLLVQDGMSVEDADHYAFGVDTSAMRLRPDRSEEAMQLNDRGAISDRAMRREVGFDETDAMTDDERAQWIMLKLAQGSPTPDMVLGAAQFLGAKFPVPQEPTRISIDDTTTHNDAPGSKPVDTPSLRDSAADGPPDTKDARLAAAAEVMVFRALERGGNKLKTRFKAKFGAEVPKNVSASKLYMLVDIDKTEAEFLLDDAWDCIGEFSLGVPANELRAALDSYTRTLLIDKKPHSNELLAGYLALTTTTTSF